MHVLFAILRLYPFLAIPLAFIFFELGLYYRRRANPIQAVFFAAMLFFGTTGAGWLIFRGDLHSDSWVRTLTGS